MLIFLVFPASCMGWISGSLGDSSRYTAMNQVEIYGAKQGSCLSVAKLPHHEQEMLCTTRSKYRQGRKLTAVKAYSVNDESKYLIITHLPAIKLAREFHLLCSRYGKIDKINNLPDYPTGQFETTYEVKYCSINSARFAKKCLDGKNYFGGILHVCYAPELESVAETKSKLCDRINLVAKHSCERKENDLQILSKNNYTVSANKSLQMITLQSTDIQRNQINKNKRVVSFESTSAEDDNVISDSSLQISALHCDFVENYSNNIAIKSSRTKKFILDHFEKIGVQSNSDPLSVELWNKNKDLRLKKKIVSNKINFHPHAAKSYKAHSKNSILAIQQPSLCDLQKPVNFKNIKNSN